MLMKPLLIKFNNAYEFIYVDYDKLEFLDTKIKTETLHLTEILYKGETLIIPYTNLQNVKNMKDRKPIEKQYYRYLYE